LIKFVRVEKANIKEAKRKRSQVQVREEFLPLIKGGVVTFTLKSEVNNKSWRCKTDNLDNSWILKEAILNL